MSKEAYIIGNGITRKEFDLSLLADKTTFGCNAIYREFSPSYIIAIDNGPIHELRFQQNYPQHRIIVPMEDERYEAATYRPHSRRRSNAGMNCMIEAIRRGYDSLYCLGIDFIMKDPEISTDNIFDGTRNYGMDHRATEEDNLNRVKYLTWFTNNHPEVRFTFILPREDAEIHEVISNNVFGMFYDTFEARLRDKAA